MFQEGPSSNAEKTVPDFYGDEEDAPVQEPGSDPMDEEEDAEACDPLDDLFVTVQEEIDVLLRQTWSDEQLQSEGPCWTAVYLIMRLHRYDGDEVRFVRTLADLRRLFPKFHKKELVDFMRTACQCNGIELGPIT